MEKTAKTPETPVSKDGGTIQVAGKIDRDVWEKCEDRAYNEGRVKTNSGIVKVALEAYAAGATK